MASSLSRQQAIAGLVSSALWISLSLSVAIGSKWLYTVQRFAFPLFVTLVWSAVILVGSSLIVFVSKSDENSTFAKLRSSWRLLLFNAACVGLSSALESVALDATSISLNQVVRATSPVFTMLATYILDGARYSRILIALTFGMVVGAAMATAHNPEYTHVGFFTSLGATILSIGHTIAAAELMRQSGVSVMVLMAVTALPALLSIVPPFLLVELDHFRVYVHAADPALLRFHLTAVLAGGVGVFLMVLTSLLVIKFTGAHYTAIISNLKVVVLVLLADVLFHTKMTPLNTTGLVVTFVSFSAYTYLKNSPPKQQASLGVEIMMHDGARVRPVLPTHRE